jgi:hypothetical protein
MLNLALLFPPFAGLFQFAIPGIKDLFVTPFQLGLRSEVTDGAVQPHVVVMVHVSGHHPPSVLLYWFSVNWKFALGMLAVVVVDPRIML